MLVYALYVLFLIACVRRDFRPAMSSGFGDVWGGGRGVGGRVSGFPLGGGAGEGCVDAAERRARGRGLTARGAAKGERAPGVNGCGPGRGVVFPSFSGGFFCEILGDFFG